MVSGTMMSPLSILITYSYEVNEMEKHFRIITRTGMIVIDNLPNERAALKRFVDIKEMNRINKSRGRPRKYHIVKVTKTQVLYG